MRIFFGVFVLTAILGGCKTIPFGAGESQSPPASADTQPQSPAKSADSRPATKPKDAQKSPTGGGGEIKQPIVEETNPVDELFVRINERIGENKFDEASESLKTAGQLAPNDPRAEKAAIRLAEAYSQHAQTLANEGKLVEAKAELQKAGELDRTNPKAKSVAKQLAQAFADRTVKWRDEGKLSDAQSAVLSALELDPQNATANRLAKKIAQDYALRAANLLNEGKEVEARSNLDAARKLDAKNELANTLYGTLTNDPERELGGKFFRYTVKPGDTLSKVAEQYLKDQYKFYLLARYNDIAVPHNLKAGQIIKVPGTKTLAPLPAIQPIPTSATLPSPPPGPTPAEKSSHMEQVQIYDRKARECYRRQDLDCCVTSWDRVLQLDPANELAPRERERCVRLRETLNKVQTDTMDRPTTR